MKTQSEVALIKATHTNVKVALDSGDVDWSVDIVSLEGRAYHRGVASWGDLDPYRTRCGLDHADMVIVDRDLADKVLAPCRRCWR